MSCDPSVTSCPPSLPWLHIVLLVLAGLVVLSIVLSAIKIVQQYEQGVVFRLGKLVGERKPGVTFIIPFFDRLARVDMRVVSLPLAPQQVVTKDGVSLGIQAVAYSKVVNATKSQIEIEDYGVAIQQIAQAIMRKLVGQQTLAEILEHGEETVEKIKSELEKAAKDWGLEITQLELKDIDLPESMRRALAAAAEARRKADAKVIEADGELESAAKLQEAASKLDPIALRLRELQVLAEIGADNATVVVAAPSSDITSASAAGALAARRSSEAETIAPAAKALPAPPADPENYEDLGGETSE